jgi:hypothetical protein
LKPLILGISFVLTSLGLPSEFLDLPRSFDALVLSAERSVVQNLTAEAIDVRGIASDHPNLR